MPHSVRVHRCHYAFFFRPRFQVGSCDFGRFRGAIIDWLWWTFEVRMSKPHYELP